MARKRLRHTRNCSESVRNSILNKRAASLFKKAEEFSILCDVKIAVIIFNPGELEPIVYPSSNQVEVVLKGYIKCPEAEKFRKLVRHETYLLEKVNAREKDLIKIEKMNEEKEMELLFNQLVEGKNINELDARQLKGLLKLSAIKMAKLAERKKQLNQQNQPNVEPRDENENVENVANQSDGYGLHHVMPSASLMEDLINDSWFMETMAAYHNNMGFESGSGAELAPIEGYDSNAAENKVGHPKNLD